MLRRPSAWHVQLSDKVVRWLLQSNHPAVHVITLIDLRMDTVIDIIKKDACQMGAGRRKGCVGVRLVRPANVDGEDSVASSGSKGYNDPGL